MNSKRGERERREKEKKKRFLQLLLLGSEFEPKRSESELATSPLSELGKIIPLGRITHSARADSVSKLSFR